MRSKWIHIPVLQVLVPPRSARTETILVPRISPEGRVRDCRAAALTARRDGRVRGWQGSDAHIPA